MKYLITFAACALAPSAVQAIYFTNPQQGDVWTSAVGQTLTWKHQSGDATIGTLLLESINKNPKLSATVVLASSVNLLSNSLAFPSSAVFTTSTSSEYRLLLVDQTDPNTVYTQVGPVEIDSFAAASTAGTASSSHTSSFVAPPHHVSPSSAKMFPPQSVSKIPAARMTSLRSKSDHASPKTSSIAHPSSASKSSYRSSSSSSTSRHVVPLASTAGASPKTSASPAAPQQPSSIVPQSAVSASAPISSSGALAQLDTSPPAASATTAFSTTLATTTATTTTTTTTTATTLKTASGTSSATSAQPTPSKSSASSTVSGLRSNAIVLGLVAVLLTKLVLL